MRMLQMLLLLLLLLLMMLMFMWLFFVFLMKKDGWTMMAKCTGRRRKEFHIFQFDDGSCGGGIKIVRFCGITVIGSGIMQHVQGGGVDGQLGYSDA
ncbi:hypothetical protein BDF20DRAFT_901491 [Mycotypha africana]|uniref:uncharacterized protein n=1 Tax=Mycotypha africana TaxID=64632 RepID=UPI0023004563|nr:uncharacterized protein BDF20DRAFT_901491 [Mycotypha africana]KAI8967253.1 hypothetical protein BDF20DRAFT_901491 [Mycotypha africana]